MYWMSRDQRAHDNWAAIYASNLAERQQVPLVVVFSLVPKYVDATIRQFGFLLDGLKEVESDLRKKRIPFHLLLGFAKDTVPKFAREHRAAAVVCDMSPLKGPISWATGVAQGLKEDGIPLLQVRVVLAFCVLTRFLSASSTIL